MKKPWELVIRHDGKTVKVFRPCWAEKCCMEKRVFIESFLKNN